MSETQVTGKCLKCGEDVRYVNTGRSGYWVHTATGNYISTQNGLHDSNTHFQKD
jgi:hypothetical protein